MKMGKVAKILNVDRRTIYNWVTHPDLENFFSGEARNSGSRELDESDIVILNTITLLRESGVSDWAKIAQSITNGYRRTDFPLAAMDVDTGSTPIQQFTRAISVAQELDLAVSQLAEAQKLLNEKTTALEALRQEMEQRIEQRLEIAREQHAQQLKEERERYETRLEKVSARAEAKADSLLREIGELRYKIGALERGKSSD